MPSRRDVLKLTSAATAGILMSASGVALAESTKPKIKAAGYPYDRVQAIKDGQVGIDQAEVSFYNENIYSLNAQAFGPKKTYEVTELGLIPYVSRYINEDFRDYVLIPVFISDRKSVV